MRLVSIESAEEDAAINSVIGKQTDNFLKQEIIILFSIIAKKANG